MITAALRAFAVTLWIVVLIALGAAAHQIATAHADGAATVIGHGRHDAHPVHCAMVGPTMVCRR